MTLTLAPLVAFTAKRDRGDTRYELWTGTRWLRTIETRTVFYTETTR